MAKLEKSVARVTTHEPAWLHHSLRRSYQERVAKIAYKRRPNNKPRNTGVNCPFEGND